MAMLRALVAAVLCATLALLALPAQAGRSGGQFTDPSDDFAVPSLDIRSGAIRLDTAGSARTLTMTATMRGDLVGVPADYDLVTGARQAGRCFTLGTRVRWSGVAVLQAYQVTYEVPCTSEPTLADLAALGTVLVSHVAIGEPVTAHTAARSVTVTLPAPTWLRAGSLAGFSVITHTPGLAAGSYGMVDVENYDLAGLYDGWRVR